MTSILGKVVENARILGEVILVHEEPFSFPSDQAKYALAINIKEFLGNPSLVEYFFEDKQHAKYALRKIPDAFVATVFIVESQQYGQAWPSRPTQTSPGLRNINAQWRNWKRHRPPRKVIYGIISY